MKNASALFIALAAIAGTAFAMDDWIDRIDEHLAISAFHGNVRARVSGLLDLEGYAFDQPAPGLILSDKHTLVNPRFTAFLDAQLGPNVYAFAQARVDRGFDPSDEGAHVRADEYAVRVSPWSDGRFSVQIGKFATVVGNWVERHLSWENPFVTAPVPYENLTGIWDRSAADSADTLLTWAHVPHSAGEEEEYGGEYGNGGGEYAGEYSDGGGGEYSHSDEYSAANERARSGDNDKYQRVPIIWGPSYASGVSIAGRIGKFDYAAEMKNASLSSRPDSWDVTEIGFEHPTFSGRFGFRPNEMWNLGFSASSGPYLRPEAEETLPEGKHFGDYRELLLGQDIGFAWHHWQAWAEFYETRFKIPGVGDADTFAYYFEAKYKFTAQLFGALRWNQQLFDTIRYDSENVPWGNDLWRIDAAAGYRFTPHTQLKLQYSLAHEQNASRDYSHTFAGQLTLKF